MKIGLVLEGGGMRGAYTAGVLDALLEREIYTDYVIGVSAGACNAVNYVARQRERCRRTTVEEAADKRYMGVGNFIKSGSFIDMDYIFDKLPNEIDPFDYDTFISSPTECVTVLTDAVTCESVYVPKSRIPRGSYDILAASCALPIFSPPVDVEGRKFYDGGILDPIPVDRAFADGCDKVIVVLTQPEGYIKGPQKGRAVYRLWLHKYPKISQVLCTRHEKYNYEVRHVKELEQEGKALVLRPSYDTGVTRTTRELNILEEAFALGRRDLEAVDGRLGEFITGGTK